VESYPDVLEINVLFFRASNFNKNQLSQQNLGIKVIPTETFINGLPPHPGFSASAVNLTRTREIHPIGVLVDHFSENSCVPSQLDWTVVLLPNQVSILFR